jgi:hypothetical protein
MLSQAPLDIIGNANVPMKAIKGFEDVDEKHKARVCPAPLALRRDSAAASGFDSLSTATSRRSLVRLSGRTKPDGAPG